MTIDQLLDMYATLLTTGVVAAGGAITALLAAFLLGAALLVVCGSRLWLDRLPALAQFAVVVCVLLVPGVFASMQVHQTIHADRAGHIELTRHQICTQLARRAITEADGAQVLRIMDICGTEQVLAKAIAAERTAAASSTETARILALAQAR